MSKHPPHHPADSNSDPHTSSNSGFNSGSNSRSGFDWDPADGFRSDDRPMADLVAGDPPVPITVWRTASRAGDHGASLPARLARRLVAAYSRPGEAVVDVTDDHALTSACHAGTRRHHRAWFTDVASLIVGPATTATAGTDGAASNPGGDVVDDEADTDLPTPEHGVRPSRVTRTDLGASTDGDADVRVDGRQDHARIAPAMSPADWFGDDLTDADLPSQQPPVTSVPDGASLAGLTSLVVASWPLDPDPAASRARLAWLLATCRELLRPGGCLVLVVAAPTRHLSSGQAATSATARAAAPEDFSPIVTAAARTGLAYLQHIVAVAAHVSGEDGDAFVYHVQDEELLALDHARAAGAGQQWTVAHLRVHTDLLVFTPAAPTATAPRARRTGTPGTTGSSGGEQHG